MKRFTSAFLGIAICSSLLTSCVTPKPVVRLHPEPDPGKWFFGNQYTRSVAEGVEVIAAFEGVQQGLLVFDVEVVNTSDQELLVAPERAYYHPLNNQFDTLSKRGFPLRFNAHDPETELLEVDKAVARAHAQYANQSIALLFLAAANVAANVATANQPRTEQQQQVRQMNNQAVWDGIVGLSYLNQAQYVEKINFLNNAKINWAADPLRKTTLLPNESVRGRVYFDSYIPANYVEMVMPLANAQVRFLFRQVVHNSSLTPPPTR
jgi:hypothetical protein